MRQNVNCGSQIFFIVFEKDDASKQTLQNSFVIDFKKAQYSSIDRTNRREAIGCLRALLNIQKSIVRLPVAIFMLTFFHFIRLSPTNINIVFLHISNLSTAAGRSPVVSPLFSSFTYFECFLVE